MVTGCVTPDATVNSTQPGSIIVESTVSRSRRTSGPVPTPWSSSVLISAAGTLPDPLSGIHNARCLRRPLGLMSMPALLPRSMSAATRIWAGLPCDSQVSASA